MGKNNVQAKRQAPPEQGAQEKQYSSPRRARIAAAERPKTIRETRLQFLLPIFRLRPRGNKPAAATEPERHCLPSELRDQISARSLASPENNPHGMRIAFKIDIDRAESDEKSWERP